MIESRGKQQNKSGESPELAQTIAAIHLGAIAVLNITIGILLCVGAASGLLVLPSIEFAGQYMSSEAQLQYAGSITDILTTYGVVLGLIMAITGGYQLIRAHDLNEDRMQPNVATGAGLLNPITTPLACIVFAMLALMNHWEQPVSR
jgi:hypothetical protein